MQETFWRHVALFFPFILCVIRYMYTKVDIALLDIYYINYFKTISSVRNCVEKVFPFFDTRLCVRAREKGL